MISTPVHRQAADDHPDQGGPAHLEVTLSSLPQLTDLRQEWLELESCATATFFTSWTWVGTWLATLTDHADLSLLRVREGGDIVGLAVIGLAPRTIHKLGLRFCLLNQTGDPETDAIYIEYNDVLVANHVAQKARAAALAFVAQRHQLVVQAALPDIQDAMALAELPHRLQRTDTCHFVDFSKIEAVTNLTGQLNPDSFLEPFLSSLGRNTRHQLRRALRLAQSHENLHVSRYDNIAEAKTALSAMADMHSIAWRSRKGLPGAFANTTFKAFVEHLVEAGVEPGFVDLLRVGGASHPLGFLLNFVYRGQVYAYQSGFVFTDDNRFKPGLVCHALAIAYYQSRGCLGYHFMAGSARYKEALSNATESLIWIETRPHSLISNIEDIARALWETGRNVVRAS